MKPNILRGKILNFLREIYPEGADERTIVSIFFEYHKLDHIIDALVYLSDKGYSVRKETPHPYREQEKIRIYKIAPSGIDLVEGNIDNDPGITIIREGV